MQHRFYHFLGAWMKLRFPILPTFAVLPSHNFQIQFSFHLQTSVATVISATWPSFPLALKSIHQIQKYTLFFSLSCHPCLLLLFPHPNYVKVCFMTTFLKCIWEYTMPSGLLTTWRWKERYPPKHAWHCDSYYIYIQTRQVQSRWSKWFVQISLPWASSAIK